MRVVFVVCILGALALFEDFSALATYHELTSAAEKATKERNYFEARNQLYGALLIAIDQHSKPPEIDELKTRLSRALRSTKEFKQADAIMKLRHNELRAFVKKRYQPDVWYDAAGGVYNNAIPKTRIVGVARMDKDGVIKAPIESTGASHAAGFMLLKPGDKDYDMMIKHVGGLKPGESKPIPVFR